MKPITAIALLSLAASTVLAADWPAWRGPTGQGFSDEKNVPVQWSGADNVKWKVPLAHQGNSTPVLWGDKIFLTQANRGGSVRGLLCFARADGKRLWQKDINFAEKERNWNENWYCNASPAVDGERVVVCYGSAGLYCYDLDGKELWKRTDLGSWEHPFGNAASPVLYGDLVIQWCGPNESKGRNFLLAVDKKSGKTVWEYDASFGSWSTPLVVKVNGKDQLIVGHSRDVKGAADPQTGVLQGFDPATGKVLWHCHGIDSFQYTSPIFGSGVAVAMSGYGGSALAVALGGAGDITKDRLWKHPRNNQRVGSGMVVGDHVYIIDENAVPHCYELKTGEDRWKAAPRVKGGVTWGSMVHADGRLYTLMRNGDTVVLAANPKFEVLGVNSLGAGQETNSSLAISEGEIFIRTFKHLWCISAKK